jgi:hypothetical protein
MSGCPVHSSDDAAPDRSGGEAVRIRWDLVFLTLAVGMLALVLVVSFQVT